jgi:hypothetical protein
VKVVLDGSLAGLSVVAVGSTTAGWVSVGAGSVGCSTAAPVGVAAWVGTAVLWAGTGAQALTIKTAITIPNIIFKRII